MKNTAMKYPTRTELALAVIARKRRSAAVQAELTAAGDAYTQALRDIYGDNAEAYRYRMHRHWQPRKAAERLAKAKLAFASMCE